MISLEDFRQQIDDVDQSIIQNLSQSERNEDYLDIISELTHGDKEALRSTQLHFSQRVCELLQERMIISVDIGKVKLREGRTNMIDEERKRRMIESRVEWAPDELNPKGNPSTIRFMIYLGEYKMSEKICKNNFH